MHYLTELCLGDLIIIIIIIIIIIMIIITIIIIVIKIIRRNRAKTISRPTSLLIRCLLLLLLWDSVIVLCFVVSYFVSILVLQSSRWGRESCLLCFVCLPAVS